MTSTYEPQADLSRLRPWDSNPRLITEEDVAKMVMYLQTHGFKDPIEARSEDGMVLAGHRRLLAARQLELVSGPVIWHSGMSDEEAIAYAIAHNRSSEDVAWNRPLLADALTGLPEELSPDLLGFTDKDVALLFDLDRGAADGDEEPAGGDQEPVSRLIPGEVWIIGPVTFNVFKNLDNDGLISAEKCIRKIEKLVKSKALLDGDEAMPLKAVLAEREANA